MSFDSLILRAVSAQLNETITGGEVLSVIQSSPVDFTLRMSSRGKTYNLLFSIHPVYARVHLISYYPKSEKRWHFADFLQNHIWHGTIDIIKQVGFDRIIKIRIIPRREIIEPIPKILVGEFMGKHSNVIILEESTNRILESMKHIDETMSRYRQVLPGLKYVTPPASQAIDPFSVDEDTISAVLSSGDGPPWKKLVKNFQGMSPILAKEIIARASDTSMTAIQDSFMEMMAYIKDGKFNPTVVASTSDKNDVIAVSAITLRQFQDSQAINFTSISDASEYFYQQLILRDSLLAEKAAIIQAVKKRCEALQLKHKSLSQQLAIAENADELRLKGELLIANLYRLQRGQKEIKLQNVYDPDSAEINIQLDEKLDPSGNAQRYFDEYKKAKRSKDTLIKLLDKNQAELDSLQKIIQKTENAANLEAVSDIRSALARKGIIKEKVGSARKPKVEPPLFRQFTSSEGMKIYLGRNDKENDLLIGRESSKNDMWLHAKQIEGSHVIIRNPERKPDIPKRTLLEAAIIAAKFSKAKHSTVVPVDYTWVKYVNKPRGAKPGFVIYTHEKTLFVSPSDFDKLFANQ